jgi:hypothetical protein
MPADRLQLFQYRGNRCAYCGLSVAQMMERFRTFNKVFNFHHVDPTLKHPEYEKLIRRVISSEQLDELDKCILLCAVCHAIIHGQGFNCTATVTARYQGHEAKQVFRGHMIRDYTASKARFLTNETVYLYPYQLVIGKRKPTIKFGVELKEGTFIELLAEIATHKKLSILSHKGELMFEAKHISGDDFEFFQDISFPVPDIYAYDEALKMYVWIRNGFAMLKDGAIHQAGKIRFEGSVSEIKKRHKPSNP